MELLLLVALVVGVWVLALRSLAPAPEPKRIEVVIPGETRAVPVGCLFWIVALFFLVVLFFS